MKTFVKLLVFLVVVLSVFTGCINENKRLSYVYDNANIIEEKEKYRLEDALSRLSNSWNTEWIVVTQSNNLCNQRPNLNSKNFKIFNFIKMEGKIYLILQKSNNDTRTFYLENSKDLSSFVMQEIDKEITKNILLTIIMTLSVILIIFIFLVKRSQKEVNNYKPYDYIN